MWVDKNKKYGRDMRAFEIIYDEQGRILGSEEIDIKYLFKTKDGWVQDFDDDNRIFLENHQIHLENDEIINKNLIK